MKNFKMNNKQVFYFIYLTLNLNYHRLKFNMYFIILKILKTFVNNKCLMNYGKKYVYNI